MKPLFNPRRKKVILFDLTGTLTDTKPAFRQSFLKAFAEFAGRWDPAGGGVRAEMIYDRYLKEWRSRTGKHKPKGEKAWELRKLCLDEAFRKEAMTVTPSFTRSFFQHLKQIHQDHVLAREGVDAALTTLKSRYRLAILSNNSKAAVTRKLIKLGIRRYFEKGQIFACSRPSARKPNPAAFRKALRGLGVDPKQAVMVGDSWRHDIAGALRIGLDAVWLQPSIKHIQVKTIKGRKLIKVARMSQLEKVFK